jgi:RNA polymerase sigma-70 factor, ECF subfamily
LQKKVPRQPSENPDHDPAALLEASGELVGTLYAQSNAEDWGVSRGQFASGLARSVRKRFAEVPCTPERFEEYLQTLYIEDLALACACMQGSEAAWDCFVKQYRNYLRACAGVITKGSRAGTDAQEMADSLFAELFGLSDGKRGEHSLFRYFHGRSSLKTWVRSILAQRHIDRLRESKRWEALDGEDGEPKHFFDGRQPAVHPELDPHRERYLGLFIAALTACLAALDPTDRLRLQYYYAQQLTLAEISQKLGEHESTASRNLERVRGEFRKAVENYLRVKTALSEAEILLCLQYAGDDVPIDFRKLFPEKGTEKPGEQRKEPL